MTLAKRVRTAMDHKGCNVPDLAAACRIKAPSVHGWLNGSSKSMAAGPAIRAAAFLGVSAIWLAEGEGPMLGSATSPTTDASHIASADTPKERPLIVKLLAIARQINDVGLRRVIHMIDGVQDIYPIRIGSKKGARAA